MYIYTTYIQSTDEWNYTYIYLCQLQILLIIVTVGLFIFEIIKSINEKKKEKRETHFTKKCNLCANIIVYIYTRINCTSCIKLAYNRL